jgi:hypothetical protein
LINESGLSLGAVPIARLNPVERLRYKIARDDCLRARERYFAVRIVPTLLAWAALVAAASAVAGALVPPGASLTLYFSGAAVLVVWLERRARSLLAMP